MVGMSPLLPLPAAIPLGVSLSSSYIPVGVSVISGAAQRLCQPPHAVDESTLIFVSPSTRRHGAECDCHAARDGSRVNRILIAEDEQRIASFVEKGLRANGFTPTVVGDGPSALAHALSGDFDLLVLDIGLPGMDGFTVLRRLRESRGSIPIIILTARDSVTDTVAGLEGGADD